MIAAGLLAVAAAIICAGYTINVGLDNLADAVRRRSSTGGGTNG